MKEFFLFLTLIIYLVSWIGFGFYFKTLKKEALKISQLVLIIGFFFHTLFWIKRIYEIFQTFLLYFADIINFLSWQIVLIYFFFNKSKIKVYTLGFFLLPLVLFLFILSYFFPTILSPFNPYLKSIWFPLHAILSLFSHGFLLIGLIVSIMYLLQEYEIKRKKLGIFFKKLPPLDSLDRINEKCLYLGFTFLTLGIISGIIWSDLYLGSYWRWSSKEIITLILWIIYAILIHQRVLIGWRGKRVAYMFILGFLIWFFSFFVLNLLFKGFHTYAG
ncbi:MAG: cytochrome c biogenesis protein [Thermodesulfobacteriaceae bacterium]|nr:cytochrome c biogenesis protein [Thermodesulfobacteriaceae bacterium]MCX8041060.1 cytochrome c biogenesis protein [Thermodesulfobacteriaceae bacterium]MDW8135624.1 cytochrome c biogenesis protein CcsA [Thermodesulfobacterium sp.]